MQGAEADEHRIIRPNGLVLQPVLTFIVVPRYFALSRALFFFKVRLNMRGKKFVHNMIVNFNITHIIGTVLDIIQ